MKRKIRRISGYFENFSQSRSPNFWIIRKGFFRDGISTPSQRQKIEFRNSKYKNILAAIFLLFSFLFFTNEALATITFQTPGAIAYSTSGGTSVSPAYPASIAANDLLVLIVGMKPSTANSGSVTTPTGWTADASLVGAGGYGTTLGGDTGNTNIFAFYKVAVGTETGSLSVSIATNNISWTQIYRFSNTTGVWNISGTTGSDTTGNTSVSIAMSANPGVSALDFILGAMVIPTDVSTPSQFSGEALSQTGVTFGAVTEISEPDSNTGNDIGGVTYYAPVTAGTASSVPTFTATAGGTVTNVRGPGIFIRIRELITTTLATGTDPSATTIAPGAAATDVNQFTLQTNSGTETISSVTVNLSTNSGVGLLAITDNANNVLGSTASPVTGSNTISVVGMSAGTTITTFKVRVTPLSHTTMPAPAGGQYSVTAPVTSWASSTTHAGSDTNANALTIDNLSPAATTGATATPGDAQVSLSWTNPADADFSNVVILRDTATIGSGSTPTEGTSPIVGSSCGGTLCQVRYILSGTSLVDTGLTNGTTYFYRIFTKDTNGNYSAVGTVPTGSPSTPSPTAFNIVATSGANGTVAPSGTTAVAQGNSQAYTITPDSGYGVATLVVDSVSIATSNTYTFTNVQAGHTISATFSILPITHTITSSVGSNGTISPLGATLVASSSSQTYTITPNTGFIVATLVVDSVSIATSTSYTFTNVIANHTISATFSLIPPPPGSFTIIATSGANGTVSPSGSIVVTQGNSQPYTITPDTGYYIGTLIIDSSLVATSTTYTFTNVQANHTIEATFVSSPVAPTVIIDTGTSRPTTITFLGTAFPGGKVSILNKELRSEEIVGQEVLAGTDGSFSISFVGILQGLHSFGLIVKDKEGRTSQTKFFLVDTRSDGFMEKDILVPPTIDTANGQVSRGSNAIIYGYASPNHSISLSIDGILVKETPAEKDGSYKFEIPTGPFNFGQHSVKTKQISSDKKRESDFSISRTFIVSQLSVVKADFSGDGKIDIKDWSIFLFRWSTKNATARESIDLNSDGKVDITDFSIFIKTIRKI